MSDSVGGVPPITVHLSIGRTVSNLEVAVDSERRPSNQRAATPIVAGRPISVDRSLAKAVTARRVERSANALDGVLAADPSTDPAFSLPTRSPGSPKRPGTRSSGG